MTRLIEVERDVETEKKEGAAEPILEALAREKKRNEELLVRLKYMQADLENYRKRMDKELKDAGESLARALAGKLVVVQDELDLALRHAKGKADPELMEGIEMVRRNLMGALESVGVQRIESEGKPFDPALHEAVEKIQGGDGGEDRVAEELRPGYTFRGQLLRPSMVKVQLASAGAGEEEVKDE